MDAESPLTRRELLSCVDLGKSLTAELDVKQLRDKILQKVCELLPAENWSLLLVDPVSSDLRFELSVELDLDLVKEVRLPMGEGIAGQVALQQKPMIIEDVARCAFFSSAVDRISGTRTRSIICVPLVFGGRTLGVIEVVNPRSLDTRALPLLSIIADYAAIALENTRRYQYIQELAVHDDLTGLFNSRHLYRLLPDLLSSARQEDNVLSLVFMDLDNFKQVVDTLGHLKGSEILRQVAKTITHCLAEPAFGVRYGGDEFISVLPGLGKPDALQKAEEIRLQIAETEYLPPDGHGLAVTASFGVATYPEDATDMRQMLALADKAMFDAKESGKDVIKPA